jgi:hypothetical protein
MKLVISLKITKISFEVINFYNDGYEDDYEIFEVFNIGKNL